MRALANSDKLRHPGEDRHGSLVFYDFLGFTTVVYPKRIGEIVNLATVACVLVSLLRKNNARNGSRGEHNASVSTANFVGIKINRRLL